MDKSGLAGATNVRVWHKADIDRLRVVALVFGLGFAFAQMPMPSISLQGDKKRQLTPEEQERQKQLDQDYKAAAKKVPDQKATDPWASVRPTPTVPAKKKQQ